LTSIIAAVQAFSACWSPETAPMPIAIETIACNFVGQFKVGDNLGFNAELLQKLMAANEGGALNKFIVLQSGAIVEAALQQIIYRAQNHTVEGVPNISEADRTQIEERTVDTFNVIIDVLKKYKVLDGLGADIYDELHKLRKYRNKVHIQKPIGIPNVSADEGTAFSDEIRKWALGLNVRVLKHLSEKFARPKELHGYVGALTVPSAQ
jgi:hypothetical protein